MRLPGGAISRAESRCPREPMGEISTTPPPVRSSSGRLQPARQPTSAPERRCLDGTTRTLPVARARQARLNVPYLGVSTRRAGRRGAARSLNAARGRESPPIRHPPSTGRPERLQAAVGEAVSAVACERPAGRRRPGRAPHRPGSPLDGIDIRWHEVVDPRSPQPPRPSTRAPAVHQVPLRKRRAGRGDPVHQRRPSAGDRLHPLGVFDLKPDFDMYRNTAPTAIRTRYGEDIPPPSTIRTYAASHRRPSPPSPSPGLPRR
ncbi:hypothetical protein L615_000300000470 [Nocardioides sp. J9]|nr:hypothetical protein L615_000300000470 [Nocardioides sp. J9]